jgi:hypothetical protein
MLDAIKHNKMKTSKILFAVLIVSTTIAFTSCVKGDDTSSIKIPENSVNFDGQTLDVGEAYLIDDGDVFGNSAHGLAVAFELYYNRNYRGYIEVRTLNAGKTFPIGKTTYNLNENPDKTPEIGDLYGYACSVTFEEGTPTEGTMTVETSNSNGIYNFNITFSLKTENNVAISGKYSGWLEIATRH